MVINTPGPGSKLIAAVARLDEQIKALTLLNAEKFAAIYRLFDEKDRQSETTQKSVQLATEKAEEAQARVNITQNEFRGALKDYVAGCATTDQVDTIRKELTASATKIDLERLVDRVTNLELSDSSMSGRDRGTKGVKESGIAVAGVVLAILAILATVVQVFWRAK